MAPDHCPHRADAGGSVFGGCRGGPGRRPPRHDPREEAGFEDLLAMTQVKMPVQAKLEMARNFWDEMGRGSEKGMHGPMLERLAGFFQLSPTPETVVPEALALGN